MNILIHKNRLLAVNEEPAATPAAIDPASVVITNAAGKVLAPATNQLPAGAVAPQAVNASNALATVPDSRLTTFAVGYPQDELDVLANFFAPRVPAPLKFDYVSRPKGNAYGTVDNDLIGIGGLPGVVVPDVATTVTGLLQMRGLEVQMDAQEKAAYDATPGWSSEVEFQDRITEVIDWCRRGRLQRVMAAAAAATGAADAENWGSSENPISDLRGYINTVAKYVGDRSLVRLAFGSTAWELLVKHQIWTGTAGGYQPVDEARVALAVGIPAANIHVNYLQVVSSAQGVTTTTTDLFSASDIYIFAASANPNRRDPSFMKTFTMMFNGAPTYVYEYQPHPNFWRKGLAYYEKIAATNSGAADRISVS